MAVIRRVVNGFGCSVRVEGAGPVLLLVHGFPLNRTMWDPLMDDFDGWSKVAPDLRGFGDSQSTASDYSMGLFADDLAALLDSISADRAVFCGLSMGGYIGFEMLRRHRDRVRALILMATHPYADSGDVRAARTEQIQAVRAGRLAEVTDSLIPKLVAPEALDTGAPVVNAIRAILASANATGVAGALAAMRERPDSSPDLPSIDVPTLVVAGSEDQIVPLEKARAYAALIPNARLDVIEGSGHMTPMERPVETSAAVRAFLEGL